MGELRWLSSRGPIKQAALDIDALPKMAVEATVFSLGAWAGSLQALELTVYDPKASEYFWLANLRHLTLLNLAVETGGPANQFAAVSTLGRLRSLQWQVGLLGGTQKDGQHPELPLPPNLEHLLHVSNKEEADWGLGRLSTLTHLQSLHLHFVHPSKFEAALGALTGLTCLEVIYCGEVPAGVSALTALRLLCLAGDDIGSTPEGQASLRLITQLPRLEFLHLGMPGMLPPLGRLSPPLALRCLNLRCSSGLHRQATFSDASWLGSLEALRCWWWQVSSLAPLKPTMPSFFLLTAHLSEYVSHDAMCKG